MIKLNNQQITALANKFYNEILDKTDKQNEIKKKEFQETFRPVFDVGMKILKENNKILKNIQIYITKNESSYLEHKSIFEDWVDSWTINDMFKNKHRIKNLSVDNIKQDIILSTIDSESIEDIMNILNKKYK